MASGITSCVSYKYGLYTTSLLTNLRSDADLLCMSMYVVGNWGRDGEELDEPVNTQNPQNRSEASNVHMFQTYD